MNVEDILRKLVAFPVLGGESNLEIIHWIADYIESYDIPVNLLYNDEKTKANLHCRIGPEVDNGVILSGHTDVVPVEGQEWDTNPFQLVDKGDGKLYARGACDMKGFLACCLAVLPEMVKANLKRPIYFGFTYDEEIGCLQGPALAKTFNSFYKETPKYAIIGEPSLLKPIVGQKGIYIMETYVNGSAGHSSRIKQEVSAIHESMRLMQWLENRMDQFISEERFDARFEPPHSTIHVGMMQGGIAPNVIADKAHFYWDLRTIPMDSVDTVVSEYKAYCRAREAALRRIFPEFEIKNIENHPPVPHLDTKDEDDVVDFIKTICGDDTTTTVAFASEVGQYANEGFESVICGPGSIAQAHRPNEFISKEQLQKGCDMLQNLVHELKQ
ncbi:MAG: acetylornithine deacetylase [Winogradskyella sp.]|uniref:acetylornithine deacetylase n=1 Tax=Winogradskyella sp. TaxID=1883156 RepID=UPI0025FA3CA4|nr:acetylornithine deacetylase [Winogradskyella sp.]NRB82269.1 acetylornithine deacetylase [Winogradskyella sp.]